jgi:two-component system LytT family response regulator
MLDKKITTVILHHNQKKLAAFSSLLKKKFDLIVLGETISSEEGLNLICNFLPQLVFVHVDLDNKQGFELVDSMQEKYITSEIVFIANNELKAFESMEYRPLDFLVEPVSDEEIKNMLMHLKMKLKKLDLLKRMNMFAVENAVVAKKVLQIKGGIFLVKPEEVILCKAEQSNSSVTLISGESVLLKTSLTETVETINNLDIVKVSRSYFINRNFLRKVERKRNRCILYCKGESYDIPASRIAIQQLENWNTKPIY